MIRRFVYLSAFIMLLSACQQGPQPKDYTGFRNADPKSLLILPAVNKSLEVTAPDYFLSTISVPLAERGYYVFPVNLVKRVMEEDGMSDANMVQKQDPVRLASLFGADAILYVTIERWDSQYIVLSTTTTVEIQYVIKDGATGAELWRQDETLVYQPNAGNSGIAGLIAGAIVAAIERASPDYMPLARKANAAALLTPHQGIPAGPYSKAYKKDLGNF